jgi:hypothetical protein
MDGGRRPTVGSLLFQANPSLPPHHQYGDLVLPMRNYSGSWSCFRSEGPLSCEKGAQKGFSGGYHHPWDEHKPILDIIAALRAGILLRSFAGSGHQLLRSPFLQRVKFALASLAPVFSGKIITEEVLDQLQSARVLTCVRLHSFTKIFGARLASRERRSSDR